MGISCRINVRGNVANRQGSGIEWRRVAVPLWLLCFLFASILASGFGSPASPSGRDEVTAKVVLIEGQGPHDKRCPGEAGEMGYHHCCSSPSCPASVITDSAVVVVRNRHVPTIAPAEVILQGRPISPEAQPPKLLSRL